MSTLYRNGRIYGAAEPAATAVLVADTTIIWVGNEHAAPPPDADLVCDLDGALVTPAFVDAHVHATATGLALTTLDLAGSRSLAEALDRVERAARAGRGRPVLAGGWDESAWPEARAPTAAELDRAGYGGVVYLARVDAHSAVVSSALLATVAGLSALPGYRPDGRLTDRAHDAARTAALTALNPSQTRTAQQATLTHAAGLGIACLHEMAGPAISSAEDLAALLALSATGAGPEVIGYWGELLGIDTAVEIGAVGAGGDLFCDGSIGSHTAALRVPYADAPQTSGILHHTVSDITEHLVRCAAARLQAGFHAIGDAAVELVLDAVDAATTRLGHPAGRGNRIEHAEMVSDPARLAASGLIASMQPSFDATWGGAEGMYARRLGPERARGLNRFSELVAAGVGLAFGSDAPVTPLDPWGAVRAAAYPHDPTAAVEPATAFTAHTRGGWRAAGRGGEGRLEPGAPATFAVWLVGESAADAAQRRRPAASRAHAVELPDLRPGRPLPTCVLTVRNGRVIFDRAG